MEGERFEKAKTGVFWDAEDCKIPCGLNALSVSKHIRSALKDTCYHGLTSIFAYASSEDIMLGFNSSTGRVVYRTPAALDYSGGGDIYENESPETTDISSRNEGAKYSPAIVMNPTRPGDKGQRYGALLTGVFSWALDNPPPANLILVVGDIAEHKFRFIGAFNHLNSTGFNVAFVQPENQAAPELFTLGRRVWPWERLSLGQGPIPKLKPEYSVVRVSPNLNLLGVGGLACFLIVTIVMDRMATR